MLESRTFKNIFSPNCYQCESDAMPIQYTVYFYTVYIYSLEPDTLHSAYRPAYTHTVLITKINV